jgi:hypothetical protein
MDSSGGIEFIAEVLGRAFFGCFDSDLEDST